MRLGVHSCGILHVVGVRGARARILTAVNATHGSGVDCIRIARYVVSFQLEP